MGISIIVRVNICIHLPHGVVSLTRFSEASERLSKSLGIQAYRGWSGDSLFSLYERALFDPSTLQRWLLGQKRLGNATPLASIWTMILGSHDVEPAATNDGEQQVIESMKSSSGTESRKRRRVLESEGASDNHLGDRRLASEKAVHITMSTDKSGSENRLQHNFIPLELIQQQLEQQHRLKQFPWISEWTPVRLPSYGEAADGEQLLDLDQLPLTEEGMAGQHASQESNDVESHVEEFSMDISGSTSLKEPRVTEIVPRREGFLRRSIYLPKVQEVWATAHKGVRREKRACVMIDHRIIHF